MDRAPVPRVDGTDPDVVVLLHGVGVGGPAFAPLAADLAASCAVVVPDRRGYGAQAGRDPATTLDRLVDDVAELIVDLGERHGTAPALVGVSGGATLGLAVALRAAAGELTGLGPVVVHEPLLGPLVPALHEGVTTSHRLTVAADPALAPTYVAGLVGPATWAALDPAERSAVTDRTPTITTEIPLFLTFAPSLADLATLRDLPLTSSIGGWSPPARRQAHELLVDVAAARPCEVADAGHLPQVDAPTAFASCIRGALERPRPRGAQR